MYANLAALKAEFGVSSGESDSGAGSGSDAQGPVHAFKSVNAAKCSSNRGLAEAMNTINLMNDCVMGPLRLLSDIVNTLSGILGGGMLNLPFAEIGKLIAALTGGIQSLGSINLGIAQIHVNIQVKAQVTAGSVTSGVAGWVSFDKDLIARAKKVKEMVKDKKKLKEILKEKVINFAKNTQAWQIAEGIEKKVTNSITGVRDEIKKMDEKENQAMKTCDAILKIAHMLKSLICDIFAMLMAFISALQAIQLAIGATGTVIAEVVQILQAVMSILSQFLALLQDLLNFLTSLCVEAETISVKMLVNTVSSVKEKFRELGYNAMATVGGPGI